MSLTAQVAYDSVTAFMKGYAANLSKGGVFIASAEPLPPGTAVDFVLAIRNGQRVIRGKGVVRWSRGAATPFERPRPAGMGVQFTELDSESRSLVDLIVSGRGPEAKVAEPPPPEAIEGTEAHGAQRGPRPAAAPGPLEFPAFAPPKISPLQAGPSTPKAVPPGMKPGTTARTEAAASPAPAVSPELSSAIARAQLEALEKESPRTGSLAQGFAARAPAAPAPPAPTASPALKAVAPPPSPPATLPPKPAAPPSPAPVTPTVTLAQAAAPSLPPAPRESQRAAEVTGEASPAAPPKAEPPQAASAQMDALSARGVEALRLTRAIDALRRKEYSTAETELQKAVAQDPQNARIRFELGLVYYEWSDAKLRHHDGAAEACFSRAAELDTTYDQPLVYLGQVQLRRRLFKDAEASFREALRRNPHSRAAREGLSLGSAMRWKRLAVAGGSTACAVLLLGVLALRAAPAESQAAPRERVVIREVAVPTPVAAPAPVVAAPAPAVAAPAPVVAAAAVPAPAAPPAQTAESAPEKEAAPKSLVKRPARTGSKAAALGKKGDAALRAGKVDEALSAFQDALKSDASFAPAHRGMGSVYVMLGREADAVAAYKRYLSLAPNASDAGRIQGLLAGLN